MPNPRLLKSAGLRIVVIFAVVAVLCLGLCQVGSYLDRQNHQTGLDGIDFYAAIGLVLSVCGVLLGLVVAVVEAIIARLKRDKR